MKTRKKARHLGPRSQAAAAMTSTAPDGSRLSDSSRSWLCLSVHVPVEAAETVASLLVELGSDGAIETIVETTSVQEPTTDVQGFFPIWTDRSALCDAVTRALRDASIVLPTGAPPPLSLTEITDDTWTSDWRKHFPPLAVGERFLLLPPWEAVPVCTERLVLIINPGMAFGTGHHATTQSCLRALETLYRRHGAPPSALDLGTGSGILAIALAKLGTPVVWATDVDPIAREEAKKNIALNHVESQVTVSGRAVEDLPGPFPLIVANLFATTLITLAPALRAVATPGGYVILSGMQRDQEGEVRAGYRGPDWREDFRLAQDEWVTLVLQPT